jgi:hypothetical protein
MVASKEGRNDPCPCGSGKKYKKCCIERERASNVGDEAARRMAGGSSYDLPPPSGGSAQQLVDFAAPFLRGNIGSPEATKEALSLGVLFWNLALLPDAHRERALDEMLDGKTEDEREEFRSIAGQMVERHRLMFPEQHLGRG